MRSARTADAALAGLAAGLVAVNRWQDVVVPLALFPAVLTLVPAPPRRRLRQLFLAALAAIAVCGLQVLAWIRCFGVPWLVPQGESYLRWGEPRPIPLLLSAYHGLLPWTPALGLGLVGLLLAARTGERLQARLASGGLVAALACAYVSSVPVDWWGGNAYGPRRFTVLVPLAALGLAALLRPLGPPFRAVVAGGVLGWMIVTTAAYLTGFDDLWFAFTGRRDGFAPSEPQTTALPSFDGPLPVLPPFVRPGFALREPPSPLDRLAGLGVILAVVAGSLWLRARLRDDARVRRAVLALGLLALVAFAGRLALAPANAPFDRAWARILSSDPPPRSEWPPPLAAAGRFVKGE